MKQKKYSKHIFNDLFLDGCSYGNWLDKSNHKEFIDSLEGDEKASIIPPLEGDEKLKVKGIKILTPNKLLTRLSVLIA